MQCVCDLFSTFSFMVILMCTYYSFLRNLLTCSSFKTEDVLTGLIFFTIHSLQQMWYIRPFICLFSCHVHMLTVNISKSGKENPVETIRKTTQQKRHCLDEMSALL